MARFSGNVGYGSMTEVRPGVWSDAITEVPYFGDVLNPTFSNVPTDQVNDGINSGTRISVVADAYAVQNFLNIKYVSWAGSLFKVTNVSLERPRLVLSLGGVYDGPRPTP